ncbi:hypothetical protein BDV26DRAFT_286636 [Aspergillus bertholletiae]|uniref:Heterokaryon incompatibility domain-containing protein n=1 Tax=Aspergillus bertholletiae TaxID=1226010 RepID=A0A5N7AQN2_9EURO|nr:hypothetical protein BDV26DRAFT_286636 [Aspergillus bertholletiae]
MLNYCYQSVSYNRSAIPPADISDYTLERLFHDDCSGRRDIDMESLCQPCRHMRLGHLVRCVLLLGVKEKVIHRSKFGISSTNPLGIYSMQLKPGTLGEVQARSISCQTCRTLVHHASEIADRNKFASHEEIRLLVNIKTWFGGLIEIRLYLSGPVYIDENAMRFLATSDYLSDNDLVSLQRPQPQVNWNAVASWLQDCDNNTKHVNLCRPESCRPSVRGFRVIDIKKRCVVLAAQPCKYATLSYVWGKVENSLYATTKNIGDLEKEGPLTKANNLPATINGAIDACSSLHIPFLWVDRLCILQDEALDLKAIHLNAMGKIYNQSYLTLIPRWTGQTQSICLISKWRTRGWTFQEAMLSPRLLVFSDQGLFYEYHGKGTYNEETSRCQYSTHFSGAILWRTIDGTYPMRLQDVPERFPSWSWSSIDNIILLQRAGSRVRCRLSVSLAQWAILAQGNPQSSLKMLPSTSTLQSELSSDRSKADGLTRITRLAVLQAWKAGCFPGRLPECLNKEATWEQYDAIIHQKWNSIAEMVDEAYSVQWEQLPLQSQESKFPIQMQRACADGCIMLYTQSQRLQIREPNEHRILSKLLSKDGDIVGWLTHNSINWERIQRIPRWNHGAQFDILALSIMEYEYDFGDNMYMDYGEPANMYDAPCINLMVIETRDGIVLRIRSTLY